MQDNRNHLDDANDLSYDNQSQEEVFVNEVNTKDTETDDIRSVDLSESNDLEKLKNEVGEYKDKYVRLFAEFDNFKRRSAKERIELIQTAGKEVITSLLDVLDDCDRAEKQINTSTDILQIKDGIQLIFNKLKNTLQSKGLKAMESMKTSFDVEKHEAITEIEVTDQLKGKVVDEVVKGYYLNDKLIRFAKVVVGK